MCAHGNCLDAMERILSLFHGAEVSILEEKCTLQRSKGLTTPLALQRNEHGLFGAAPTAD